MLIGSLSGPARWTGNAGNGAASIDYQLTNTRYQQMTTELQMDLDNIETILFHINPETLPDTYWSLQSAGATPAQQIKMMEAKADVLRAAGKLRKVVELLEAEQ